MNEAVTRWVFRRARGVFAVSAIVFVVSLFFTMRLYQNLRPDLEELLPQRARSVVDGKAVANRMPSVDYLAVLVFGETPEQSKKFITQLAQDLSSSTSPLIAFVDFNAKEDLNFYAKNQGLFVDLEDLHALKADLPKRIQYEKDTRFDIVGNDWQEPALDLGALQKKYASRSGFLKSGDPDFYSTQDRKVYVIEVGISSEARGIDDLKQFKTVVSDAVWRVQQSSSDLNSLKVHYTGGVQDRIEEHESLLSDLGKVTALVFFLIFAVMYLFYPSSISIAALGYSLALGTALTCAITYALVGYINMNSAFLASIIIGNGVNFGVILMARYLEELRRNSGNLRAVWVASKQTRQATLTAALAAGIAYGSLMVTEFRGFQQFGFMGLIGMILCWATAYIVFPSVLIVFGKVVERRYYKRSQKRVMDLHNWIGQHLASFVKLHPRKIVAFTTVLSIASIVFLARRSGDLIETDLTKMRDQHSLEAGSGHYSQYLHKIFSGYPHPLVVMSHTDEQSSDFAQKLKARIGLPDSLIGKVVAIDDFVPHNQSAKLPLLKDIRELLKDPALKHASDEQFELIQTFLNSNTERAFTKSDLPPKTKRLLSERNGTLGHLLLVEPIIGRTESMADLTKFIAEVRAVGDQGSPPAHVAGQLAVSNDLVNSIQKEAPPITLLSFLAVVVLVILLFREFKMCLLLIGSLVLGVLWLTGVQSIFDIKINFVNFIVLPITFGIGVDYGVNILARYRRNLNQGVVGALKNSGSAVLLASLTTIIGYGGLLLAGNQAIASFGRLAVIGEFTCLFAGLFSVPAIIFLGERLLRPNSFNLRAKTFDVSSTTAGASDANRIASDQRQV